MDYLKVEVMCNPINNDLGRLMKTQHPLTRLKRCNNAVKMSFTCLLLIFLSQNSWAIEVSKIPLEKRLQPHASVDDIARQINQQQKWRILSAEPTVEDEKTLYRFKLLNKKGGRVRVIIIDPNNPDLTYLN